MATFERYFISEPETHKETKNSYYSLLDSEEVLNRILEEFGLDTKKSVESEKISDSCRIAASVDSKGSWATKRIPGCSTSACSAGACSVCTGSVRVVVI